MKAMDLADYLPWKADQQEDPISNMKLQRLLYYAQAFHLVAPGGAQMLYDQAGSTDKTLRLHQGLYHEVFNEPERAQALADVEAWLEARV